MPQFDPAPKRATNLSLNAKVLDAARALGMNLSATVDALLAAEVQKRYWARWNEDNKDAIAHYNARIEREGTISQRMRRHLEQSPPSTDAGI